MIEATGPACGHPNWIEDGVCPTCRQWRTENAAEFPRIADGTLGALIEVVGDPDTETFSPLRRDYILRALHELVERRAADQSRVIHDR